MLGLTFIDIVVFIVVGLSIFNGVRKGFTTEALKLVSWAGAIFITLVVKPLVSDLFSTFITVKFAADIVAIAVVFIATLIALNFLGKFIGERIRTSFIGPVDRSLGGIFGLFRGTIVVATLFLIFSQFVKEKDYPASLTDAMTLPYLEIGALVVAEVTPDLFEGAKNFTNGYTKDEREEMEDLIEETTDES